jgi:hypothetical protein
VTGGKAARRRWVVDVLTVIVSVASLKVWASLSAWRLDAPPPPPLQSLLQYRGEGGPQRRPNSEFNQDPRKGRINDNDVRAPVGDHRH